jgi:predicted DsbA family dithiol-disulfide isomerase
MKIEIWSDVVCPWCYIGKKRFETALAGFAHRDAVDVTWRSFELDPDAPQGSDMSLDEMLSRKYGMSVEDAQKANERVTRLAEAEGMAWRLDVARPGNSLAAHRLVHLAGAGSAGAAGAAGSTSLAGLLHERLMKGYFSEGLSIGDPEALVPLAVAAGLDEAAVRKTFGSDAFQRDVREDEERAAQLGITGVPFFAIEERWGISGAQPLETFKEALEKSWQELHASAV